MSVGTQPHAPESSGFGEFIALMAVAMSLVALSIDMMLPAFPEMTRDLQPPSPNDIQLVISLMFVGVVPIRPMSLMQVSPQSFGQPETPIFNFQGSGLP